VLPRQVAFAALIIAVANSARAQSRQGTVDITVDVMPNAAHVEERYLLAPSGAPIALRVLTRPCATIGNLAVERAGSVVSVTESRTGPWVTFRDTTQGQDDSIRLVVRYDVRPAGARVIPLVHLTSAVTGDVSTRTSPVKVLVTVSDTAALVSFPHMTRQAPSDWSARYVAVPSFVEIAGRRAAPCDEGGRAGGDNGGLVWRFLVLVGIMITWVPLYLAWARRSSEGEHT
jgi:hypothetical protein